MYTSKQSVHIVFPSNNFIFFSFAVFEIIVFKESLAGTWWHISLFNVKAKLLSENTFWLG